MKAPLSNEQTILSFFRPSFQPEPLLNKGFFDTENLGYSRTARNNTPVLKTLISVGFDQLQTQQELDNYVMPTETLDKRQGRFTAHRAQQFIRKSRTNYLAPIQATYHGLNTLAYTPINPKRFQNPTLDTDDIVPKIDKPIFY